MIKNHVDSVSNIRMTEYMLTSDMNVDFIMLFFLPFFLFRFMSSLVPQTINSKRPEIDEPETDYSIHNHRYSKDEMY